MGIFLWGGIDMLKYVIKIFNLVIFNSGAVKMEKRITDLLPIVDNYTESIIMKEIGSLGLPIEIDQIIRKYGIVKKESKLPENEFGAIVINDDFSAMIINETDHVTRKRFTAAHELGHFISYRYRGLTGTRIDKRDSRSSNGTDIEEIFANKFAAAILMPKSINRS